MQSFRVLMDCSSLKILKSVNSIFFFDEFDEKPLL